MMDGRLLPQVCPILAVLLHTVPLCGEDKSSSDTDENTLVAFHHHRSHLPLNYSHVLKQGYDIDQCYLAQLASNAASSVLILTLTTRTWRSLKPSIRLSEGSVKDPRLGFDV